jgi:hypothetical protein
MTGSGDRNKPKQAIAITEIRILRHLFRLNLRKIRTDI